MKKVKQIISTLLVVLMLVTSVPLSGFTNLDFGSLFATKAEAASDTIYKVKLTWLATPRDLDSHLRGKDSAGDDFHIYYSDSSVYDTDGSLLAYLDVDDTDGYGPEYVTIFRPIKGVTYSYFVYNYSDDDRIAGCGAVVELYKNDVLLKKWVAPRSNSDGRYWNVFQIRDGKLIERNRIEESETFSEVTDITNDYGDSNDYVNTTIKFKEKENDSEKNATVSFRKNWFDPSVTDHNFIYNHNLAQFCSSYCMFGYSPEIYEYNINSYLDQIGFHVLQSNMDAARDEVNYFIAAKTVYYGNDRKNILFVGTIGSNKEQWYSNFDPYGYDRQNGEGRDETGIHCGFTDAMNFVAKKLNSIFNDPTYGLTKENTILLFTGHSRGAATANLLAAKAVNGGKWANSDSIYAYTFATPNNTADENYNDKKYAFIKNIVNPEDLVTHVMLKDTWGYHKYGMVYVLPSKTNTSSENYKTYLKSMNNYYKQYKADEYEPYPKGEKATYDIIKEFNKKVKSIDDFYNKPFMYVEFPWTRKPYKFFQETLLPYVSGVNKAYGILNMTNILLHPNLGFYYKIITYFANPDIDFSFDNGVELGLGGRFAQAHDMATYCAYMQSLLSNVVTSEKSSKYGQWNCPVDIEIYDNETNELVGRIVNNIVDEDIEAKENSVVMSVDGDTKSYYLPSDGDYTVKIIGNDDGTADYTLTTIDSDSNELERINYFDIDVSNDSQMTSLIESGASIEEIELVDDNDNVIEADEYFENVEDAICEVNVDVEGSGFVTGDGKAKSGDYVELTAISQCSTFLGWYKNDELISDEETYKFRVTEDIELMAKFTEGNHSFKEEVTEPTCANSGNTANVCENCGLTEIISETDPLGHIYVDHEAQDQTCVEIGWEAYQTCSRCEYSTYVELPAYGHNFTIQADYSNVSDNGDGTHSVHCVNCDMTGDPEEHTFEDGTSTEPTCTEDGFVTYLCSYCDAENVVIDEGTATGHKEEIIPSVDPTCTTDGKTEKVICSVCEVILVEQTTLAKLGHIDADGNSICEVCENSIFSEIIPDVVKTINIVSEQISCLKFVPTVSGTYTFTSLSDDDTYGYLYDANMKELAKDDDDGYGYNFSITYDLTAGQTYYWGAEFLDEYSGSFEVILTLDEAFEDSHIHSYTSTITKAATCTETGIRTYTCSCGESTLTETISALGHSYSTAWTTDKAATCTAEGSKSHHCTRCDAKTDVTTIAKTAHKSTTIPAVAATCTKTGLTAGTKCSVCGTVLTAQTTIKATGHNLKTTTTKATTSKDGKTVTACTVCGTTTKTVAIAKVSTVKLSKTSYTYDGEAKKPTVTVKDSNGKTLKSGTDYSVSYASGRKKIGSYTVKVTLKGNYTGTKTLTFKIVPSQVKGLKASSVSTTAIKLSWTKVAGAKYYKVEQSTDGKKWKTVTTTDKTTYKVSKLKTGAKYSYRVTALDSTKKVAGKVSAVLKTGTKTAAPTVTLKSTKSKTATASWKKVTGASKYIVYKSTDNKKWTKVTSTTKLKYNLTKLTGGKKIYVKVVAVNAYKQNSAYSKVASVTVKK